MLYTFEFEKIQTKGPIVPLNFRTDPKQQQRNTLLNNTNKRNFLKYNYMSKA